MHNDCLICLEYNKTLGAQTHSLFSQAKHLFSQFIYPPSLDKSHHLFTCQRIPVDLWQNHLSCVLVVFPLRAHGAQALCSMKSVQVNETSKQCQTSRLA